MGALLSLPLLALPSVGSVGIFRILVVDAC